MTTTTIHEHRPFNLRYIVREGEGIHGDDRRATHHTAMCNYFYIMRENGKDERGPTPDFASRRDLFDHGRCAPKEGFGKDYVGIQPWEAADVSATVRRPELATAMHAVGSLPQDGTGASWRAKIEAFGEDYLASQGMIVDWAIHCLPDGADGFEILPHVHFLISSRVWRKAGHHGRHQKTWLSTKARVDRLADAWFKITGLHPSDLPQAGRLTLAARAATAV
jgi:hypothetical protein